MYNNLSYDQTSDMISPRSPTIRISVK